MITNVCSHNGSTSLLCMSALPIEVFKYKPFFKVDFFVSQIIFFCLCQSKANKASCPATDVNWWCVCHVFTYTSTANCSYIHIYFKKVHFLCLDIVFCSQYSLRTATGFCLSFQLTSGYWWHCRIVENKSCLLAE